MKEILLTNSDRLVLVDDEDYPVLARLKWSLDDCGYAKNGQMRMHRLILGFPRHQDADHADRNKLNNQKSNLRLTTRQKNLFNRPSQRNNSSGFKGVHLTKRGLRKPWQASIKKDKTYYLGRYATAEEAARAYDAKAKELFGEFAYLNFPDGCVQ